MKVFIVRSPVGYFAFSNSELVYYQLFERNPVKALDKFQNFSEEFLNKLKGYQVEEREEAKKTLRKKIREYAISLGFAKNDEELNQFLSEFALLLSRKKMKLAITPDRLIIQASNALEDLNKILNSLFMRLNEWFGLHYPECKLKNEELVSAVINYGRRENFPDFKESVGVELSEDDEKIVRKYAKEISNLIEEKKDLEKYIRNSMRKIAPNLSSLMDELLSARLLALAGSLEKLSKMSASTIQLLGSEKALFRHLRGKGKAPKHGLIFLDPRIQNAKEENRGKVARTIAAKLMLAARIDFYSGRFEPKLKNELESEIKVLR